jgi:HEAT repeat protein
VVAFLFLSSSSILVSGQDLPELAASVRNGNVENKRDALLALRNLGTEDASRAAIPALGDTDEIVRATAVSAVLHLPPDEVVTLLIPLTNDSAEFVRREAVFALGELGDASATNALVASLKSDKMDIVRAAAANALGKAGGVAALSTLVTVLSNKPRDEDEYLRRSAAR